MTLSSSSPGVFTNGKEGSHATRIYLKYLVEILREKLNGYFQQSEMLKQTIFSISIVAHPTSIMEMKRRTYLRKDQKYH